MSEKEQQQGNKKKKRGIMYSGGGVASKVRSGCMSVSINILWRANRIIICWIPTAGGGGYAIFCTPLPPSPACRIRDDELSYMGELVWIGCAYVELIRNPDFSNLLSLLTFSEDGGH